MVVGVGGLKLVMNAANITRRRRRPSARLGARALIPATAIVTVHAIITRATSTTATAQVPRRRQRRRLHHPRRAQAGSLRIQNIPPAQDHRASGNVVRDITNLVTRATSAKPRRAVLLAIDVRRVAMRGGLRRLSAFHATTTCHRMVNIREELSRKDRVHGSARQDTTNLAIRALRAKRRAHKDNFWEANRARQEAHTIPGRAQAARRRVLLANISRDAVTPMQDPAQRVLLHVVLAHIGRDAPVRVLVVAQAVPPTRVALGNIWTAAVASALEHARVVRHAEQTNSDPTAVAQARACANRAIRF